MVAGRLNVPAGTRWAVEVGYSRAVRAGSVIAVAGTVGADASGRAVAADSHGQAKAALEKIRIALAECGATFADVLRTRMFVVGPENAPGVLKAHGESFRGIEPASTLVLVSGLIEPQFVVEIEADAVVAERQRRPDRRSVLRPSMPSVPRAASRIAGRGRKGSKKEKT